MVCRNRSLFRIKEGHIGLAPRTAAVGDQVAILLNCSSAMILRPNGEDEFQVVGEAYYHGFMDCEAFLGPISSSLHLICRRSQGWWPHIDSISCGVYIEDPRLGPLPPNWTRDSDYEDLLTMIYTRYMDAETIKKVLYTCYVDAETIKKLENLVDLSYPKFVNKETGEKMTDGADPRITLEAFEARGVKFQTFNLV